MSDRELGILLAIGGVFGLAMVLITRSIAGPGLPPAEDPALTAMRDSVHELALDHAASLARTLQSIQPDSRYRRYTTLNGRGAR